MVGVLENLNRDLAGCLPADATVAVRIADLLARLSSVVAHLPAVPARTRGPIYAQDGH